MFGDCVRGSYVTCMRAEPFHPVFLMFLYELTAKQRTTKKNETKILILIRAYILCGLT
jgi:hypothetical protein